MDIKKLADKIENLFIKYDVKEYIKGFQLGSFYMILGRLEIIIDKESNKNMITFQDGTDTPITYSYSYDDFLITIEKVLKDRLYLIEKEDKKGFLN